MKSLAPKLKVEKSRKNTAKKVNSRGERLIVGNPNICGINQFQSKHKGILRTIPTNKNINKPVTPATIIGLIMLQYIFILFIVCPFHFYQKFFPNSYRISFYLILYFYRLYLH